jgi:hypothetical protein
MISAPSSDQQAGMIFAVSAPSRRRREICLSGNDFSHSLQEGFAPAATLRRKKEPHSATLYFLKNGISACL